MPSAAQIAEALPIVLSLILIEGLLSVDNALAIAAMASHLPKEQQKRALRIGIVCAYIFRGIALALVSWIQGNLWVKFFGAGYLIYLMCSHLTQKENHDDTKKLRVKGFWMTVVSIEMMDLTLSIDNVIAAVALSNKLWVIITGVFIAILVLRLLAGYALGLIARFPVLGPTAFLLVGYVGFLLIFEMISHAHVSAMGKFTGILLIMLTSLAYGQFPSVKKILRPVVQLGQWPMLWFVWLCGMLVFPFTYLLGKLRPETA